MTRLPDLSRVFDFFIFKAIAAQVIVIGREGHGRAVHEPRGEKKRNERFRSRSLANFERSLRLYLCTSLQRICGSTSKNKYDMFAWFFFGPMILQNR